jgi:hypothetical protein
MAIPQSGDILIRSITDSSFELLEAVTLTHVAGPFPDIGAAVNAAQTRGSGIIWQQSVDYRGRPLGDAYELPRRLDGR